ncbi:CYTH domain-containing protein [[Actinomadura] parvosata]|uniref:CYTH domain-containing protein n=1 Tax=[Actinomadura] parvosata TaxID=1955412 RepID=UPI00406C9494
MARADRTTVVKPADDRARSEGNLLTCEDQTEIEFKFLPQKSEQETVLAVTRLAGPEYGWAKWPPCVNVDIYLDTPDLDLYHANAPLRIRHWGTPFKYKLGASVNFKYPPGAGEGLRRRELKTILTEEEAQRACAGAVIGNSLQQATDFLRIDLGRTARFTPQVMVSTFCSHYALRRRLSSDGNRIARGKASTLLMLSFEECVIRDIPDEDIARVLKNGMFDLDPEAPLEHFGEAEVEVMAGPRDMDTAVDLYSDIFRWIRDSGQEMPLRSKYSVAMEAVQAWRR